MVAVASRARLAWAWPLLAALVSAPGSLRAEAPAAVSVSVDATAVGAPLEAVWPFYGYDEVNYTTSSEGKALLEALVAGNTAPVHVRSHFLLNNGDGTPAMKWGSTNVYSEDDAGNPVYDWKLTDGILDALSTAGAYPFVELGFMPEALSSHPTPYRNTSSTMLDGGCFYPPTDYAKWADLIRTWATHARERYPDAEAHWLWELWNEPDLPYWNGTLDEYAKLYDYTEAAVHDALPNASLGGPAVAGAASLFLRQFLQHCAEGTNAVSGATGTRLDLVSFHAKGGVTIAGDHVQMNLGSQLRQHRAGFKAVAAFPQFKQTPIYITEADPDACAACPASTLPANAYRTSPAYGAYELAMMKRSLELGAQVGIKLGGVLTWAFTFPDTPYFSGYRTLRTNGIDLPVLSAFKLLGRLSGTRLPLSSSGARALDDVVTNSVVDQPELDGMATADGNLVQVLVWNYHDDLVTAPATPVHVAIKVPQSFGPRAQVSHLRVDESHGDAFTVWVGQGKPPHPSDAQVAALQKAMVPSPLVPDRVVGVPSGGTVELDFDVPRFGVSLITLRPTTAAIGVAPTPGTPEADGACACRIGRGARNGASALGVLAIVLVSWTRRRRAVFGRFEPKNAGESGPAWRA